MIDVPQRRAIVSHSLGDRRESILPSLCARSSSASLPFPPSFFPTFSLWTGCKEKKKNDNVTLTQKRGGGWRERDREIALLQHTRTFEGNV